MSLRKLSIACRVLGGWIVSFANGNTIKATKSVENVWSADIKIIYSARGYSIVYVDSTGLEYNAKDDTIKDYMNWIEALDEQIKEQLKFIKGQGPQYFKTIPGAIPS